MTDVKTILVGTIGQGVLRSADGGETWGRIGIGAGLGCNGQVLVMHDILGWGFTKFTKTYVDVKGAMEKAFKDYVHDVKAGAFPAEEHAFK